MMLIEWLLSIFVVCIDSSSNEAELDQQIKLKLKGVL